MVNIWWLASAMAVVSWCFSPVISFYINKKLSKMYEYDASEKFPELVADTIPNLKFALREIEEQWMLKKLSPRESAGLFRLDKLASLLENLKTAFYEAEDIVDDINFHQIDDTNSLQRYWRCICDPIQKGLALVVVQLMREKQPRSGAILPSYRARPSSYKTITNRLAKAYEFAKYHRDRFNKNASFKSYEQDAACTIPRPLYNRLQKNMERIDKLFDEAQKCTSFKQKLQESVEQASQPRSDARGSRANVTAKDKQVTADPAIKVTGREKDLEEIRTMLHDSSSSENVIGICGIPGSGKTTLAQYVYQSEKEGGHFDHVMWIHVSENFSVDAIFRQMYEAASTNGDGKNVCPQYSSLEALRRELMNKLQKKRLLLVLDDIWDSKVGNRQGLTEVVSVFKVGWKGSKILVTSRQESALLALGPDVRYKSLPIPPLDNKDFIELLMYYAHVDTRYRGPLYTIGKKIARKLKGSPLVARLVGGILSTEHDINFWRTVLDREHLNETPGADLWWCYQHLDENVRRCFAFCSIFPRGHHLFRDELVNLWVAAGFIRRIDEGEEMEDVGGEYFRVLVSTSFLQPGGKDLFNNDYYLVHDLLHKLAVEVAGSEYFRIENGLRLIENKWSSSWTGEIRPDVRHLFVRNYIAALVTGKILKLENLRTLIIYAVQDRVSVEYEVIESIFHRLRKLRVLAIAFTHGINKIQEPVSVPECVCQSQHLRYLALRTIHRGRVTFPSTPTKLYHVRLLDVGDAQDLEFSCGDFTNLRHILGKELLTVQNMGKMISLQTVPYFCVSDEQGYEIKQLRDLNKLRGSLSIDGLENVASKLEALEANLAAKERLTKLTLQWDRVFQAQVDQEIEAEVLEGLCPPVGLETLHIFNYRGVRYPNWMIGEQNGGQMYLKDLVFLLCSQQGPPPNLKAFIHLQSLELSDCSWDALPGNMEDLTSLKELLIERCLGIMSLPTLPRSIEELTLSYCNAELMRSCKEKGHVNWQKIEHIPHQNFNFLRRDC